MPGVGGRADQAVIAERLLSISGEDSIPSTANMIGLDRPAAGALHDPDQRAAAHRRHSSALAGRFHRPAAQQSSTAARITALPIACRRAAGILNWALDGYRRLRQRGHFVQPASASEAIEELEVLARRSRPSSASAASSAPASTCRSNCFIKAGNSGAKPTAARTRTKQSFGCDLKATMPNLRTVQPRDGDSRYRSYEGIDLKEAS